MNADKASTRFLVSEILACVLVLACGSAVAGDMVVVGESGEALFFSTWGENGTLSTAVEGLPYRRFVTDAHCDAANRKLFVATDHGKLFELDLADLLKDYRWIDADGGYVGVSHYDARAGRPVWAHREGEDQPFSGFRYRGEDARVQVSDNDDITFRDGSLYGISIEGWKTSRDLDEENEGLSFLVEKYPNADWLIIGRSADIEVYARKTVDLISVGEPYRATLLFHDRTRKKWRSEEFPRECGVAVYDGVAVMREIGDVKGDRIENGNEIPGSPTGKWYFFIPSEHELLSREIDPALKVRYATAEEAIVTGDGKVSRLELAGPEHGKPAHLFDLPKGFTVTALCPLQPHRAGAVQATDFPAPDCSLPEESDFPLRGTAQYWGIFNSVEDRARTLAVLYSLGRRDSLLYGSYLYKKIGLPIRLSGCVDPDGRFVLEETDLEGAVTGRMTGQFEPPVDRFTDFEGLWTAADGPGRFAFWGALTTSGSASGIDCVGNSGGILREEEGTFEPLPAERLPRTNRRQFMRFGPFDRAEYGLDSAVAGFRRSCESRELEHGADIGMEKRCDTELIVGIIDGDQTSWWVRRFEQDWGGPSDGSWPFRLTEAAAPSLPKIVVTEETEWTFNYSGGAITTNYLIELDGGEPRLTWAQQCEVYEGVRDWNGHHGYSQICRWVPERNDFLCREASGYSPLWATRIGFRQFWLEAGEPHFSTKPGVSTFRTPEAFLEVLARESEKLEERIVIDHVGPVTLIESLRLSTDRQLHLFGAPQREAEPGARFFVADLGPGGESRWDEIPASRLRYGDDDRSCGEEQPVLFHAPTPEEDLYTPEESDYRFVARPIDSGDPGLRMLRVLATEKVPDYGDCRSIYWIVIDPRLPGTAARAILLTTEGLNGGSGLDLEAVHFPRTIEVGSARSGGLGSLRVSPPVSPDLKAPRDRMRGCRCPQWIELSWNSSAGFGIVVDDDSCTEADRGYEESEIGPTGEIVPRQPPPPLAEQIFDRLREGGIDAAVERVSECYRDGSDDHERFDVLGEIVAATESLLSEGRVKEAVAIMDPVRWKALDRFTQMLVDAGRPYNAVILIKKTVLARDPGIDKVERACAILVEAGHRSVAISLSRAYIDKWWERHPASAVEQFEEKVRGWKAGARSAPGK